MTKISEGLPILSALLITIILIVGMDCSSLFNKQGPVITFPLLDGRDLYRSSLAGKPGLISLWTSTCDTGTV